VVVVVVVVVLLLVVLVVLLVLLLLVLFCVPTFNPRFLTFPYSPIFTHMHPHAPIFTQALFCARWYKC
jgi:hypothetical protein